MKKKLKVFYILGHSRSGSTILGFRLGALKTSFFAGEIKKYDKRVLQRRCTCKQMAEDCPFWKKFNVENRAYLTSSNINAGWIRKTLSLLNFVLLGPNSKAVAKEEEVLRSMDTIINESFGNYEYIIDSSKSLNRFILLHSSPNIEVYPIYLKRNVRDNLASFVKRKQGVLANYFRLKINDWIIRRYLTRNKIAFINISYEEFTSAEKESTQKIYDFFAIDAQEYIEGDHIEYHVLTGSKNTRDAYQKSSFVKISNRNHDEPFTKFQKRILSIMKI